MVSSDSKSEPPLSDLLASLPPREVSGSRSSSRFAYQQSWALALTLRLHEQEGDYCVLFDLHDDVVTLNDSISPTSADFYQVKTKATGKWTVAQITRRSPSKKPDSDEQLPSMLGKLYDHYVRFGQYVGRLAIVSNVPFDLKMTESPHGVGRSVICVADAEKTVLKRISDKIQSEHSLVSEPSGLSLTHLEKTDLSLDDHHTHLVGKVTDFLSRQGDGTIPPAPFARTAAAEIRRRNDRVPDTNDFAILAKKKGLSRVQFQEMIDSVQSKQQHEDLLASLRGQLDQECSDFGRRHRIMDAARTFLALRQNQADLRLVDAIKRVRAELSSRGTRDRDPPVVSLMDQVDALAALQADEWTPIRDGYSDSLLEALFAVLIYEHAISATGTQPSEKSP